MLRLAVGSSRMITLASTASARASSTICCCATLSRPTGTFGSAGKSRRFRAVRASLRAAAQLTKPATLRSRPSTMFWMAFNCGTRLTS